MKRIHENSRETYGAIAPRLSGSQQRVLSVIRERESVTRQGIAVSLGVPINEVTGRVRELLDAGLVMECGTDKSSGRSRALLKVRPPPQPPAEARQLTNQQGLF